MLIAWMAYAVLFGVLTYGAALAADRVAATWGKGQRHVWVVALIVATVVPMIFATRRGSPVVAPLDPSVGAIAGDTTIAIAHTTGAAPESSRESLRARANRSIALADPYLVRVWLFASLAWLTLLARAAIVVRRRRAYWRAVEIDGTSILVSPSVGPAVVGAFSPRVVIPQWALALDASSRALMLRHEAEHIRARDPLLLLGAALATTLVPWNAAVWILVRRLRLAIEIDCDRRVLRANARRREYGELLLTVGARQSAPLPFATSLAERRPFLERRIRAMTTNRPRHPRLVSAACIALAIVATTAAVRAPRPASLITPVTPAAPQVPRLETVPPTPAPVAMTEVPALKVATPPTPKPAATALAVADTPGVPLTAVRPPRAKQSPDTLSVEEIRALIATHHPSALTGDPDINTITIIVDARGNYVVSTAESRPFVMAGGGRGRSGGTGPAAGFGGGEGAGFSRGRVGGLGAPTADSAEVRRRLAELKMKLESSESPARDRAPGSATAEDSAMLKRRLDELKTRLAKVMGDTIILNERQQMIFDGIVTRGDSEKVMTKLAIERAGGMLGINMDVVSRFIDPQSIDSIQIHTFAAGQLGTTPLRVYVVRQRP